MRFLCVVALFAVIASAAGDYSTCGVSGNKDYSNTTGCTAAATCASSYCTCTGGTVATGGSCSMKLASCDTSARCAEKFLECMEAAARAATNTDACMAPLKNLHDGLVLLSTGMGMWNTSNQYTACKYAVCMLYNATTTGTCNATNDYAAVCYGSPVTFSGVLTLSGNWSAIFANGTALKEAEKCLALDLTNHLRFPVTIISITKDANGGAMVEYTVDAAKASIEQQLNAAQNSTAWLQCLSAAKFAALGGTGTLKPIFSDTPTPVPGGSPPPSPPTPPPTPPPAGASMMWSAVQVIAAVVAVLVIA